MRATLPLALTALLTLSACSGGDAPPAQPSAETPAPSSQQAAAEPVAAGNEDLAPLFGTWGLDPASCDQVLRISETRFEGAENGCDISGYTDNGDGTYTAAMTCTSQGQSADESIKMRPIFAPTGEGIELTYLNRNNLETTLLRCPDAR